MELKIVASEQELQEAFSIRKTVFVEEQHVPLVEEIDHHEDEATHFVLVEDQRAIGAGRFREVEGIGKVERICVLQEARGTGAGKEIMLGIELFAKANGFHTLKLNAQTYAIPFYEKLGYTVISDEFMDAGIPHKTMKKTLVY